MLPAMLALPCRDDVDVGLPVERQRHGAAQLDVVERGPVAIDQDVDWYVGRHQAAGRRSAAAPRRPSSAATVISPTNVMSNSPATKARTRVERLVTMRQSMASRWGSPFFQ